MLNEGQLNKQYETFLQSANCTSLSCLRQLPLSDIKLATQRSYERSYNSGDFSYGTYYWGPAVDGHILRERPLEAFSQGHFHKVPMLINRDGNEGFTFTNTSLATEDEVISDLERSWPERTFLAELLALYPDSFYNTSMIEDLTAVQALEAALGAPLSLSNAFVRRESLFGDALVNCPTAYIASAASKAGLATYKMIFGTGTQFHGATQPFLFSETINRESLKNIEIIDGYLLITSDWTASGETSFGPVTIPGNATLASILRDYFISFAIAIDPNSTPSSTTARPTWPSYRSADDESVILRLQDNGIMISQDPDINARCQYLSSSVTYLERI